MSGRSAGTKGDRRSRRSQQLLFQALLGLIREKDYAQITISEITERADVARATFYLHYDDKDALLLSSLDALFERVAEEVERFSKQDLLHGLPHPALVIFEVVQRDPKLFHVILKGQGGARMLHRFRAYVAEGAERLLDNVERPLLVPTDIAVDFVAGALLSVIMGWLDRGMTTPARDLANLFYQMIRPSLLSMLALDQTGAAPRRP